LEVRKSEELLYLSLEMIGSRDEKNRHGKRENRNWAGKKE
jgi:hypothetical protein